MVEIPHFPPIDLSFAMVSSAVPSVMDSRIVQLEKERTFCNGTIY